MNEYRGVISIEGKKNKQYHVDTSIEAENIEEAICRTVQKYKRFFLMPIKILNIDLKPYTGSPEEHMRKSLLWETKACWVSVENKLPPTASWVLAYVKGSGIWVALYKHQEDEPWSFPSYNADAINFKDADVTHWMRIPQPLLRD